MGLDMYLMAERRLTGWHGREHFTPADKPLFVNGYDFAEPAERAAYRDVLAKSDLTDCAAKQSPTAEVVGEMARVTVAYWRKANHIHNWFVQNVQGGEDRNCEVTPVTREQLQDLVDACKLVLGSTVLEPARIERGYQIVKDVTTSVSSNPSGVRRVPIMREGEHLRDTRIAMDVLPTQGGFFFGGTGYDDYYWWALEQTVEQIERALTAPPDTSFFYQSSW